MSGISTNYPTIPEPISGQRIVLAPNDVNSTPRRVRGILAYRTSQSYFVMVGRAALACEFPKFAWHLVIEDEVKS